MSDRSQPQGGRAAVRLRAFIGAVGVLLAAVAAMADLTVAMLAFVGGATWVSAIFIGTNRSMGRR